MIAPVPQLPEMRPDDTYTARLVATIPPELRGLDAWVCWKWALAPAPRRKGKGADPDAPTPRKITKVPYNAHTGAKAASNDPQTWAPFGEALAAYQRGGYAGLGLMFAPGAELVGVDLDKCRDLQSGELAPWAIAIVQRLASYTEISPSGTGVHIILCATLPGKTHSRTGAIEIYAAGRFFTMTGERLADTPSGVEERGRPLVEWYGELFAPAAAAAATKRRQDRPARRAPISAPLALSDGEIIVRAMRAKNAAKFSALWSGNTAGYASDSEADSALIWILRFYTQGDAARMDALFRQSGRMRDKWDERHFSTGETYGERTISEALAGVYEVWTRRQDRPARAPTVPAPAPAPAPVPVAAMPAPAEYPPMEPAPIRRAAPRRSVEDDSSEGAEQLAGALYLRDTRYGSLWYAPDAAPTGLYVMPRRGAPYCILSARVDPIRVATHAGAHAGRGSEYLLAFTPDLAPDHPVTLTLTRDAAMTGALYTDSGLENVCSHTPADKTDLALCWQALTSLVSHLCAHTPALRARTAPGLSWYEGAWARVDGYIDAVGAHKDTDLMVTGVSPEWPQRMPAALDTLPDVVDATIIRKLLAFWPRDVTLYPLAAWGACAYIMRPHTEGRARWELEVFGPTGSGKTALTNAILRAFFGPGYEYDTGTQLTGGKGGDTPLGRMLMRARLRHHAYMTYDYNARRGQPEYDKQQQERIDSADATGNKIGGGAKSTRDGGLEMRPAPMGLLIRTGESDPHEYSIEYKKASSDSRCVTFLLDVAMGALQDEALAMSQAIFGCAVELDALAIAHTRWLAALAQAPAECVEQWHRLRTDAAWLVGAIDCEGAYPMRHTRALGQCEDLAAGLASYAAFLRVADLDTGADDWRMVRGGAALADDFDALSPELIRAILAASHDLMQRHADAAGGATACEAQAAAFLAWIRGKLFDRELFLTGQLSDSPRAMPAPAPLDHMGWESNRVTGAYSPGTRARRLGALSDNGRYVILDNQTLETLASQAARDVKAIAYTTLPRFKADLLASGAIEGYAADPEHRYVRNVRICEWDVAKSEYVEALRWRVHILAARIWPQTYIDHLIAPETTETPETPETTPLACGRETPLQAESGADPLDTDPLLAGADSSTGHRKQPETTPPAGYAPDALDAGEIPQPAPVLSDRARDIAERARRAGADAWAADRHRRGRTSSEGDELI